METKKKYNNKNSYCLELNLSKYNMLKGKSELMYKLRKLSSIPLDPKKLLIKTCSTLLTQIFCDVFSLF